MFYKISLSLLLVLLFFPNSYSQNTDAKEKLAEKLNSYFAVERENIHLHLNKNTYLSEEAIWFKGYTYNRKEMLPFYSTTNVFVVLFNQTGTKISQQLAYSNTGSFEGSFTNLQDLSSGNYYIQVYTNWMNNFQEDESTTYPIKIVNLSKPDFFDTTFINLNTAKIEIHPEGGTLLAGVSNIVGIKVSDKFGNPIGNLTVELVNSEEQVISEISINKEGFGRFTIVPKNESYSVQVKPNGKDVKFQLPNPSTKGLSLEVNTYAIPDKIIVKVKTNTVSINDYQSKKLYLIVHQDNRALIFDLKLDLNSLDQTLVFASENIATGINTVRIVDEDLNQLAERTIINLPKSSSVINLTKNVNKSGYVNIEGSSSKENANLSLSILPLHSLNVEINASITTDFLCNSYLVDPLKKVDLNDANNTIATKYELDLALLNQTKSKYSWRQIIENPPTAKHEFDMGLTIKGKLFSPTLKNYEDYTVRLRSFHHLISVESDVNTSAEFEFKHLILSDSTMVDFGFFKNGDSKPMKFNYSARVVNSDKLFKHIFKGFNAVDLEEAINTNNTELPSFSKDIIQLKTVEVEAKKNPLKRIKNFENANLRGFVIPETLTMSVLMYIGSNGFDVVDRDMNVSINVRGRSSINASQPTPLVYVDNVQIYDFSYLQGIRMNEMDEIYMNPHAIIASVRGNQGIIRMYRRALKFRPQEGNLKSVALANGFTTPAKFKNVNYTSTVNEGFNKYGVINWIPSVLTDENNKFQIDVPNYNQKKVKVLIEGFTYNGALISETIIIDL